MGTGAWAATVWRLGVPAALMVAFLLIGLAPESWRGDKVSNPRKTGQTPARRESVGPTRGAAIGARTPAPDRPEAGARLEQPPETVGRGETGDEPAEPTPRLPSELAPVAPDIVVMLQSLSGPLVPAPADAVDGVQGEAGQMTPQAATEVRDDIQGPEPGAPYWFGPLGLEQVRPLE